jgi:hypothetical protein
VNPLICKAQAPCRSFFTALITYITMQSDLYDWTDDTSHNAKQIGAMIREEMLRNGFASSTIRKYLPQDAKMMSKARSQFAPKYSANPQDYSIEQVETYQKKFLIELVRYLHN